MVEISTQHIYNARLRKVPRRYVSSGRSVVWRRRCRNVAAPPDDHDVKLCVWAGCDAALVSQRAQRLAYGLSSDEALLVITSPKRRGFV